MAEQPGGPDAARLCWPRLRVPPITPPGARFRSRFTAPPFFRWARPPPAHCDGRASPRGIRGSGGPQASPLSAWMLTQARWATHGMPCAYVPSAERGLRDRRGRADVGSGGSLRPSNGAATVVAMRAYATLDRPTRAGYRPFACAWR
jgi:hypothetical protein